MALLIRVVCISVVAQTEHFFFEIFALNDSILGFVVTFVQPDFPFEF